MIGVDNSQVVFGRGVSSSKASSVQCRVLARLEKLLSLENPDWYVLMMAGDADDPEKQRLVSGEFAPLERGPGSEAGLRFVVCFLSPKDVCHNQWAKIKVFHQDYGRLGSPIFIGHPAAQPIESSPIWLDTGVARGATYVVERFLFHALVEID